jgi:hypothetical protein
MNELKAGGSEHVQPCQNCCHHLTGGKQKQKGGLTAALD